MQSYSLKSHIKADRKKKVVLYSEEIFLLQSKLSLNLKTIRKIYAIW